MRKVIIYTNPDQDKKLESYLSDHKQQQDINVFDLDKMNLKYCTGCWSCWWKTPGQCAINDGIADIYKAMIHSDRIIYVAPLILGGICSSLKTLIERQIPLVHPYITIVKKETHHKKRYKKYPSIAAYLGVEGDTDEEDKEINRIYFNRLALNFYSRVDFVQFSDEVKEVSHELFSY